MDKHVGKWIVLAFVPMAILVCGVFHLRTQAQDVSEDIAAANQQLEEQIRDELALAVARVGVNEAGWDSPADIALVWQVTQGHGRTSIDRLAWLRRHSSCVLTDRPLTEFETLRGNCSWARHLTDNDLEPAGWPQHWVWTNYVHRWQRVRELARELAAGRRRNLWPCAETPFSWGGLMDHARAIALGMRPLHCRNPHTQRPTLNDGFVRVDPS